MIKFYKSKNQFTNKLKFKYWWDLLKMIFQIQMRSLQMNFVIDFIVSGYQLFSINELTYRLSA